MEGEAAFATCTGALRQHARGPGTGSVDSSRRERMERSAAKRCTEAQPLRPELLALLRGNLRRLWRCDAKGDAKG